MAAAVQRAIVVGAEGTPRNQRRKRVEGVGEVEVKERTKVRWKGTEDVASERQAHLLHAASRTEHDGAAVGGTVVVAIAGAHDGRVHVRAHK